MRSHSRRGAFTFIALMLGVVALWLWLQGSGTGEGQTVAVKPDGANEQPVGKQAAGTAEGKTQAERGDAEAAQGSARIREDTGR